MATVTLEYSIAAGVHPLASLLTKVQSMGLSRGELDLLGLTVQSDDSSIVGSEVVRTIVLATTAAGDENFPTSESLTYATKNLYTQTLALCVPAQVIASDPVVEGAPSAESFVVG
jgi:hypothetical protein